MGVIRDVKSLAKGMPVLEFKAKIKTVYPRTQKTWQDKTWNQQDVIVEDGEDSIKVQLTDCEEMPKNAEGQSFRASSVSTKHGLKGFIRDEYTDKKTGQPVKLIKMSKVAKTDWGDDPLAIPASVPKPEPKVVPGSVTLMDKDKKIVTVVETPKPTDWDAKEKRDVKTRLYNSAVSSLAQSEMFKDCPPDVLGNNAKKVANIGFEYVYEIEVEPEEEGSAEDIPFGE